MQGVVWHNAHSKLATNFKPAARYIDGTPIPVPRARPRARPLARSLRQPFIAISTQAALPEFQYIPLRAPKWMKTKHSGLFLCPKFSALLPHQQSYQFMLKDRPAAISLVFILEDS